MSSIYNSDRKIEQFFLGSQEITEMFLGNELVFSKITNNLFYKLHEFVGSLTVQNTIEAPVKSAILKGNTLVNLVTQKSGSFNGTRFLRIPLSHTLKTNTKYFVKFNLRESSLTGGVTCRLRIGTSANVVGGLNSDGIINVTKDGCDSIEFYIRNANDVTNGLDAVVDDIMLIEYQNGMENWDIPYFKGMQSVKMPVLTMSNVIQRVEFEKIKVNLSDGSFTSVDYEGSSSGCMEYFDISKLTNAKFIFKTTQPFARENYFTFFFYDKDKTYIKWLNGNFTKIADGLYSSTIPTLENAKYLRVTKYDGDTQMSNIVKNSISGFVDNNLSIDSTFSIKSNILTVNEDVELREIGDVKDELNLLTGEVTERIGYNIVDGVNLKAIRYYPNDTDYAEFHIGFPELKAKAKTLSTFSPSYLKSEKPKSGESFWANDSKGAIGIFIQKTKLSELTLNGLNEYLKSNPIEFYYELATESIKTVDLTIVDQDGKTINKLNSFNGTTHVSTEVAENSTYPMVSLEVASELQAAVKID